MAAATYWVWGEYERIKNRGAVNPPSAGHAIPVDEQAWRASKDLAKDVKGFVVWSSNRSGNHELYSLSLPDLNIRQLTDNSRVDYYPRISPDGRYVAFARSKIPWVSQRNNELWDVYLLDLKTQQEQLLASDANAPVWAAPDKVVFQRKDAQVVACAISSGEQKVLFQSGTQHIPKDIRLETPDYDEEDGVLAVTIRGAMRMTALITAAGDFRKVAGGCQINWSPDKTFLYYVDHGGRKENAFYKIDPMSLTRTFWLDMPGDYSHEYFPHVSRDQKWLVFGACAHGHEHDVADYEIFLWKVGTPFEQVARLTYHTGNDCWPDIFIQP